MKVATQTFEGREVRTFEGLAPRGSGLRPGECILVTHGEEQWLVRLDVIEKGPTVNLLRWRGRAVGPDE